jgi:enoyl-CoA hydratase
MTDSVIRYEMRAAVAYVTLNRPEKLNALNPEVLSGLATAIELASEDPEVRVVVIRGAGGRAFSAGVDLTYFRDHGIMADAAKNLRFTATIRDAFLKIENAPVPTVAAVEGFALAGGLELALACDFILCTDECQIADQHANYDLMPGAGGSQRLPRRIGAQRALELLLTGRRIDGAEAARIGLALKTCPAADFDGLIEEFVAPLRAKSRAALGLLKTSVRRGLELPLREALDLERLITQEYFSGHDDASRGLASFTARKESPADSPGQD